MTAILAIAAPILGLYAVLETANARYDRRVARNRRYHPELNPGLIDSTDSYVSPRSVLYGAAMLAALWLAFA